MRRIDGRWVIAGMIGVGVVFVLLNLVFGGNGKNVRVFDNPTSVPAQRGAVIPVHLLTACAPVIDFDGEYWAPRGGWTLSPPFEPATAELVSSDRVVLRLRSTQTLRLVPQGDSIKLSNCSKPDS